jgi:excisionase family DNA binding protein
MSSVTGSTRLLTPRQVAHYLNLNLDTVYRLIRDRRLSAVRIGRTYRLTQEDLDDFVRAHSTQPEVREARFARVSEIASRNPDTDGDQLLDWLERVEVERPPPDADA